MKRLGWGKGVGGAVVGAAFLLVAAAAGCAGKPQSAEFEQDSGKSPRTDAAVDGGGGDGTTGGDAMAEADVPTLSTASITSIAIQPANATIVVSNGVIPAPMAFQVVGTTSQGSQVQLGTAMWSYSRFDVGSVDASGNFTATGFVGGVGTLTAQAQGLSATTNVTVQLQMLYDPNGVSTTFAPIFAAATTPDPQMSAIDYPYDGTVFPLGLPGPVPQWCLGAAPSCSGNATDIYDIKLSSPTAVFEAFTTTPTPAAPSFAFPTMPTDVWTKVTDSTSGALTFSIARYDGTTAYAPITETWTIAQADLAGTIYYWEINNGAVVKMPLGQGPGMFLQVPTANPAITCVACHSVSKDGSTIVAAFNGSASPWGTFETQSGSSIYVSGSDPSNGAAGSGFEAIAPDGSLVLWGQEQQLAYLTLSPNNGVTSLGQLNPGTGNPVQPSWSPDGNHVAFGVRLDGNWLDYTTSNLWIADATLGPSASVSNPTQIVANTPTRTTTIYPTFSPDSSWIAFERSTQARSRGAQAELWMTSLDGQTVMSLDQANAGTGLYAQNNANYEPTFMPVAVGGYFWLVFVSERVYGNILTDTTEGTTAAPGRHKQLWVTAIDAQPTAGQDPSHPAFWLPGQDTGDQNMRGEWALDPCLQQGQSCTAGYQCCAGFCRSEDGGTPQCTMPTGGCSASGEACTTASDCCDSTATCIAGFCNVAPQ